MKRGRLIQLALGLLIAAFGLYVFLRHVDMSGLWGEIRSTNPWTLVASAAFGVLTLVFRARRWRLILPDVEGTHKRDLFSHTIIGFMINNIIPARVGEATRALLLWRRNGYAPAVSIGSLVLERLIDIWIFLLFFAVPVLALPGLSRLRPWAWGIAAIAAAMLATIVVYALAPAPIGRLAHWAVGLIPGKPGRIVNGLGSQLATTVSWVFDPGRVLAVTGLSVLTSGCYPIVMVLLVGTPATFGFLEGMFSQAAAAFGAAIPLAPGYVGTLHAALQGALLELGMRREAAAALAIVYHAIGVIPITIIGLVYFFRADISFKEVSAAKDQISA